MGPSIHDGRKNEFNALIIAKMAARCVNLIAADAGMTEIEGTFVGMTEIEGNFR
jgi:hypothetical protein